MAFFIFNPQGAWRISWRGNFIKVAANQKNPD